MAHGANVNCLALGHKSGRVLVTGGDDKKVNLWAVGKPNCIMVSPPVYLCYCIIIHIINLQFRKLKYVIKILQLVRDTTDSVFSETRVLFFLT